MAPLPGIDTLLSYITERQYKIFVCVTYIDILLYTVLLVLCIRNFYVIVYEQSRWKQRMFLTFYIMSLTAILSRWLELIFGYTNSATIDAIG